ncbi:MAG: hypothetical protein LBL50_01300, partial [Candidatus Margulisbacteria bacterium]|nr:hypothetical protein [Candidatus Margulisiibacteriota bacterium]
MKITDQNLNPSYVPYLQKADSTETGGNEDGEINAQELQKALQLILDGKKISELSTQEQTLLRTYMDNHANDDLINTPEEISEAVETIKKALADQEKGLEDFFYADRGLNTPVPAAEKEQSKQTTAVETGYEARFSSDDPAQHGIGVNATIKGENLEIEAGIFTPAADPAKTEYSLAIKGFWNGWYLGGGDLPTPFGFLQQSDPKATFPGINVSTPSLANGVITGGFFTYAFAPGATQSMYNLVDALANKEVPVTVI